MQRERLRVFLWNEKPLFFLPAACYPLPLAGCLSVSATLPCIFMYGFLCVGGCDGFKPEFSQLLAFAFWRESLRSKLILSSCVINTGRETDPEKCRESREGAQTSLINLVTCKGLPTGKGRRALPTSSTACAKACVGTRWQHPRRRQGLVS